MEIFALDRDGTLHALDAQPTTTLMELLRDGGLGIEAVCGGSCACATCHIYADLERVGPRRQVETELLSFSTHTQENSRLSCQIKLTESHAGMTVIITPEE
jgi:2Fe-2S ferredoxin